MRRGAPGARGVTGRGRGRVRGLDGMGRGRGRRAGAAGVLNDRALGSKENHENLPWLEEIPIRCVRPPHTRTLPSAVYAHAVARPPTKKVPPRRAALGRR